MRPGFLFLIATVVGLAIAPYPDTASASCAGPSLVGDRIVLTLEGEQEVHGRDFHDGCADSEGCSSTPGCHSCEVADPESPRQDVVLGIAQHGQRWTLGTADADGHDRVAWRFELPHGVHPGPARLLVEGMRPVEVRIG
jgi:hypothetical protein